MYKTSLYVLIFFLTFSNSASAAMQSSSFRIYDSASDSESNYTGPAISGVVAAANSDATTISWQTLEVADSYVIYSTDSALAAGVEYGTPTKDSMTHDVVLAGLLPSTTYYYKVRSTGLYGGASYSSISNFTTAAKVAEDAKSASGGGIIYIERHDTIAPIITSPRVIELNSDSVIIYWQSDEQTNGFVEYAISGKTSQSSGDWKFSKDHYITLNNLESDTRYAYRVLSADTAGNIASSSLAAFTTLKGTEKGKPAEIPQKPIDITTPAGGGNQPINDLPTALSRALAALTTYEVGHRAGEFEQVVGDFIQSLKNLSGNIPRAGLIGAPKVVLDGNRAIITWQTDKLAGTQVALANNLQYKPQNSEPYYLFQGDNDKLVTNHSVTIYGLEPDTSYHYQIRSRSGLGITKKSEDYTFKSLPELPMIISYNFEILSPSKVIFRWVTSQDTDTSIRTTPIKGSTPEYNKAKANYNKQLTMIHQVEIGELDSGISYEIELSGKTKNGEAVSRKIASFSTTKDVVAPKVDQIKAEVVLTNGKQDTAQAIVSWSTSEPASSKVYYILGARNFDIQEAQMVDDLSYVEKHVAIINKLQTGQVYSYRVASADASGNPTLSNVHTVYVSRKAESVFDLIIKYFSQMFGWLGNIRQ